MDAHIKFWISCILSLSLFIASTLYLSIRKVIADVLMSHCIFTTTRVSVREKEKEKKFGRTLKSFQNNGQMHYSFLFHIDINLVLLPPAADAAVFAHVFFFSFVIFSQDFFYFDLVPYFISLSMNTQAHTHTIYLSLTTFLICFQCSLRAVYLKFSLSLSQFFSDFLNFLSLFRFFFGCWTFYLVLCVTHFLFFYCRHACNTNTTNDRREKNSNNMKKK